MEANWKAPLAALGVRRQKALSQQKQATRIANEHYFRAHPELRAMIHAFISRLLEDKPADIQEFAEQYFTDPELAHDLGYYGWSRPSTPEVADQDDDSNMNIVRMAPTPLAVTGQDARDLEEILVKLFQEADQDGSEYLDREEFLRLMETSDLGLSKQEVNMLLAEVDENEDGRISYAVGGCTSLAWSGSVPQPQTHRTRPEWLCTVGRRSLRQWRWKCCK